MADHQSPPVPFKTAHDSDIDVEAPLEKSSADQTAPTPPPNGGLVAWLQVFGAFFLMFNTWGLSNTFGIFQSEYATSFLSESSESAISWIGSLQGFLMLIVCVVCGSLLDRGHFYLTLTMGIFLEVFGMMMTSLATKYYQVLLAQGVAVGLGAGMIFIPALQIVGTYFSTRRSTAMGLAATGSGVGGIVYPLLLRSLIKSLGLRWAVRIMAFVMLGTLLIPLAVMRPRLRPRTKTPTTTPTPPLWTTVKETVPLPFALFLLAIFILYIGLYIPFFYIDAFALTLRPALSPALASNLLLIMNAASLPGRVLPAMLADRVGNLSIMVPATLLAGAVSLAWSRVNDAGGLVAGAVLLGFASGSIQAVVPGVVVFLCPDLSRLGRNVGMMLAASGVGLLVGSPVAGVILEHGDGNFGRVFVFSGAMVVAAAGLMGCVRVVKVGFGVVKA